MTKLEYIAKYGEEAYNRRLESNRIWARNTSEQRFDYRRNWANEHKEQHNAQARKYRKKNRQIGSTIYCNENYDLIENYELAKADNFDPAKWHLHHRLEHYWSVKTLKRKGLYLNLNPEALIWLPADQHNTDFSISTLHPERTKWHQRIYEGSKHEQEAKHKA